MNNKLASPLTVLHRFSKVIGLSATFGGQQGVAEVITMLPDSIFIQSPKWLKEKDMSDVEVHGGFESREILL